MIKNKLKATRETNGINRRGAEEDIKILEEHAQFYLNDEDRQSLQNLIEAYKELEEENEKKDDELIYITGQNFEELKELYIPVSLVKETIEELKNEDLEIYDTDSEDLIIAKYEQRAILDFLQEILREE